MGGPNCGLCGGTVSVPSMNAADKFYHPECFKCFKCKKKINAGEKFALKDDTLYCLEDYTKLSRESGGSGGSDVEQHKENTAVQNVKDQEETKRRNRTTITEEQLEHMKACFETIQVPNQEKKEELSRLTGLSTRVIQVWFQNRRAKEKKRNDGLKQQAFSPSPMPANASSPLARSAVASGSNGSNSRLVQRTNSNPQIGSSPLLTGASSPLASPSPGKPTLDAKRNSGVNPIQQFEHMSINSAGNRNSAGAALQQQFLAQQANLQQLGGIQQGVQPSQMMGMKMGAHPAQPMSDMQHMFNGLSGSTGTGLHRAYSAPDMNMTQMQGSLLQQLHMQQANNAGLGSNNNSNANQQQQANLAAAAASSVNANGGGIEMGSLDLDLGDLFIEKDPLDEFLTGINFNESEMVTESSGVAPSLPKGNEANNVPLNPAVQRLAGGGNTLRRANSQPNLQRVPVGSRPQSPSPLESPRSPGGVPMNAAMRMQNKAVRKRSSAPYAVVNRHGSMDDLMRQGQVGNIKTPGAYGVSSPNNFAGGNNGNNGNLFEFGGLGEDPLFATDINGLS
eukprot:Nk52_evm60s152 gene=Nk52_evmTU60s152